MLGNYFEAGGSVCPFAARCHIHYVMSHDDYTFSLSNMKRGEVVVIVCGANRIAQDFKVIKYWAISTYLKAAVVAGMISNPKASRSQISRQVKAEALPCFDDAHPLRHYIALRGEALVTICMAPIYRKTHPRYAPHPCLVLTWMQDIAEAGHLPKVRAVMEREHGGFIYDANDLMVPLP